MSRETAKDAVERAQKCINGRGNIFQNGNLAVVSLLSALLLEVVELREELRERRPDA